MKTIAELEKHLNDYRLKKIDFPTYDDLVELIEASSGVIGALAGYMTKAKAREKRLIQSAYEAGHFDGANDIENFDFDTSDVYCYAGLEELT